MVAHQKRVLGVLSSGVRAFHGHEFGWYTQKVVPAVSARQLPVEYINIALYSLTGCWKKKQSLTGYFADRVKVETASEPEMSYSSTREGSADCHTVTGQCS